MRRVGLSVDCGYDSLSVERDKRCIRIVASSDDGDIWLSLWPEQVEKLIKDLGAAINEGP